MLTLPANAGDVGSIPGSARCPGEGVAVQGRVPDWEIPGQRSLVGYGPRGCNESDMTQQLNNTNKGKETRLADLICKLLSRCPGRCAGWGGILGFSPHLRRTMWGTGWSLKLDACKTAHWGHQRATVSPGSRVLHGWPGPQEG